MERIFKFKVVDYFFLQYNGFETFFLCNFVKFRWNLM